MGLWLRTIASVVLLAVFPLLLVVLLGGLAVAQVLCFERSVGNGLKWAIVLVPAAVIMVRGLRTLVAPIDVTPPGVRLTEREHPVLWALVRRLAEVAETRPPDEIYLTADANASVVEDTRLLGLVSTRRCMLIGAPLVAGMTTAQLAAVLTHELAHYARHHTRLAVVAYRGRRALASTTAVLHGDLVQWFLRKLLSAWTTLYLRTSLGLSRRQEREADLAAARAVGSAGAANALREVAAIGASWDLFAGEHLMLGWAEGYLPEDVFEEYARLRASMAEWLDEVRATPSDDAPDRYDTHPPMARRVATLEAMGVTPVIDVDQGAAAELLQEPRTSLDAALFSALPPEARGKRRVDWTTLRRVAGMAWVSEHAAPVLDGAARLQGQPPTVRSLLTTLDEGRVVELSGIEPAPGMGPRAQRERARPVLRTGLFAVVSGVLTEAGNGSWEPTWRSGVRFVAGPGLPEPHDAIDAAVAEPADTTALRALLASAEVDLDRTMTWRGDGGNAQVDIQPQAPGGRPLSG